MDQVHFGKVNVVVRCVFKCERGRGRGGGMYRPPRPRTAPLSPTDNGRSRRRPLPPPTGSYPSHRSSLILRKRTSTSFVRPFAHLWNSGLAPSAIRPSGCSLPPPSRFDSQCKAAHRTRRDSCHGAGRGSRQGWPRPRRSVAAEPSYTFRTGA